MRILPLLLLLTLLTSCIDGDEEVWIERNGSGRIKATYRMPAKVMNTFGGAEALQQKLKKAIAQDPSLTLESIDHRTESGRIVFQFATKFDDLRELAEFPERHLRDPATPSKASPEEALFGDIDLNLNGLLLSIDRSIHFGPLLPEMARKNPAILGGSTFRYTFHLPVAASSHDAHATTNQGKTLTWSFLLRDHIDSPMKITAHAPLPLPWWIWFSVISTALLFLLLLIWAAKYTAAQR